ncbi:MAG: hypothetical protein SGARI_007164, partial [Bacillariaceae sp.]
MLYFDWHHREGQAERPRIPRLRHISRISDDDERQQQIDQYCDSLCVFCHKKETWDSGQYKTAFLVIEKDADGLAIDNFPPIPESDIDDVDRDSVLNNSVNFCGQSLRHCPCLRAVPVLLFNHDKFVTSRNRRTTIVVRRSFGGSDAAGGGRFLAIVEEMQRLGIDMNMVDGAGGAVAVERAPMGFPWEACVCVVLVMIAVCVILANLTSDNSESMITLAEDPNSVFAGGHDIEEEYEEEVAVSIDEAIELVKAEDNDGHII